MIHSNYDEAVIMLYYTRVPTQQHLHVSLFGSATYGHTSAYQNNRESRGFAASHTRANP